MAESPERAGIARRYGFETYAELLDASEELPLRPGDAARSYLVRQPNGRWFVWEAPTQNASIDSEGPVRRLDSRQ